LIAFNCPRFVSNHILIPLSAGNEDSQSQSNSTGAKDKEEGEKSELEKGG
jgi:hypothetical protein